MTVQQQSVPARLSVLIVTWNCRTLVGRCLNYLSASLINRQVETIVVDNASTDGTADWIRAHHSDVTVIDAGGNLGFGRANNLAAEQATGDYLLLLNPDAYLTDPDALGRLCAVLDEDQAREIVAVAPMLINADGSHQVGDGGFAPTIGNVARHIWLVSRLVPGAKGFHINRPALLRRHRVRVDWLAATCLLVRHAPFKEAGGFDPSFFMYGEDVDLGLRLRTTGKAQLLLPDVRVLHLQGATQRADTTTIHVSFGWIDAIFAAQPRNASARSFRLHVLASVMASGFVMRGLVYGFRGRVGQTKATAMWRYARYSWTARRPNIRLR